MGSVEPIEPAVAGAPSSLPMVEYTIKQIMEKQSFLEFMADDLQAAGSQTNSAERFLVEIQLDSKEPHVVVLCVCGVFTTELIVVIWTLHWAEEVKQRWVQVASGLITHGEGKLGP